MHLKISKCAFFEVEKLQTEVAFLFKGSDLVQILFGGKEKGNAIALQAGKSRF